MIITAKNPLLAAWLQCISVAMRARAGCNRTQPKGLGPLATQIKGNKLPRDGPTIALELLRSEPLDTRLQPNPTQGARAARLASLRQQVAARWTDHRFRVARSDHSHTAPGPLRCSRSAEPPLEQLQAAPGGNREPGNSSQPPYGSQEPGTWRLVPR